MSACFRVTTAKLTIMLLHDGRTVLAAYRMNVSGGQICGETFTIDQRICTRSSVHMLTANRRQSVHEVV